VQVFRAYLFIYSFYFCVHSLNSWVFSSSSLRSKSLQMTKSLTHSMGGYLPNTLTEMWEPSRDFVFFRLPTSGVRGVVALSGWVFLLLSLFLLFLSLLRGLSFVGCRYAIHI
jgi:hypothetical protein